VFAFSLKATDTDRQTDTNTRTYIYIYIYIYIYVSKYTDRSIVSKITCSRCVFEKGESTLLCILNESSRACFTSIDHTKHSIDEKET
jgi:hypothetical protein